MNFIKDSNISNKRVILRCDFNVSIKDGIIVDNSKIIKSLNTIKYLLNNSNKVIILSHFGRVKKEEDKRDNSLMPVYNELRKYIELEFVEDPNNLESINNSQSNCFLVENTRYTDVPEKKESINDLELAKYWASFADVFVIDAFASLHRVHSSTAGISNYLPTYYGFLVEKEINGLKPLIENIKRDFLVIMGGAKVEDKITIIKRIVTKCDKLIITGGILNAFLQIIGIYNTDTKYDDDTINNVKSIINVYKNKIYFSNSFIVKRDNNVMKIKIDELKYNDNILDNIININDHLGNVKTIFINGTCGKYEDKEFELGTKELLNDLANSNIDTFVGGGDSVSAVKYFNLENKYNYLSSGGGATLEYVADGSLKVIDYIEKNNVNN